MYDHFQVSVCGIFSGVLVGAIWLLDGTLVLQTLETQNISVPRIFA